MKVPFLDLQLQNARVASETQDAIRRAVSQCDFVLGPAVEEFEHAFADFVGTPFCVGVNNGTSALHMALIATDVKPGDEVITTPHSWISTSWAISYVGAKPVFVDIDPRTYNINVELVESAITEKTKAVLPVHLYGQAADVVQLREICDRNKLLLIEDAAQAHGAEIDGKVVGSIGDAGCFSFYPGKNLGAFGEGGAVVTHDQAIADRIRRLRDHAQQGRHHHLEIGFNTRMEGIQGAVLGVKLPHLRRWTQERREHSQFYRDALADIHGLQLPQITNEDSHVWHLFVVLVDERVAFRDSMDEKGVATGVHYPTPIPYQPAYRDLGYRVGDFPVAEDVMSRCVSLPMFPELTSQQRDAVVAAVTEVHTA